MTSGGHGSRFSTFWIKNILILYLIGGNAKKPVEKGGFGDPDGLGKRQAGRTPGDEGKGFPSMRVVFWTWMTLIATGLVFYTVIGLTHN